MITDNSFSIRIQGIAEIQRALFQFNARLGERVNRLAIRKGANYMLKEIRSAAPVSLKGSQELAGTGGKSYLHFPPGRLRRAIKIKNSKINQIRKNGSVGVFITVSPGKKRNDPKGAWYGKFVELGYNKGSKAVGGNEARVRGLVSSAQLSARRNFVNSTRRFGRTAQLVRYRYGGQHVEGKHFVLNTFNRTAPTALAIMVEASEVATAQLARQLNLNVTGA